MTAADFDHGLGQVLGSAVAGRVKKAFGYETVGELLAHFPRRYASHGELTELVLLPEGDEITIIAEVTRARERRMQARRGTIQEVVISDGVGNLTLTFFNQPWRLKELRPGVRAIFAGKVSKYNMTPQLTHPDYKLFDELMAEGSDAGEVAREWVERPIPIYPATKNLPSWKIAGMIETVLEALGPVEDPMPGTLRQAHSLLQIDQALRMIHQPAEEKDAHIARHTLRFHEAFLLQTALLQRRQAARGLPATAREAVAGGLLDRFDRALGFTLTEDQQAVGEQVMHDISQPHPMSRLIQGEVGSGKTVVALRAMLAVADTGGQAALLAPTEVLAGQHLRSIVAILGPDLSAELMPTLFTGQMTAKDRRSASLRIVSGQARIVIGTHALLGDAVSFFDLGLIVVDEQHRFGVDQREALRLKGATPPHVLILTATPIPRTVAMTVFGDLDVSTIRQLPAGRPGIESFVVPLAEKPQWIVRTWQRVVEELALGRQVFVVCPAISASEPDPDLDIAAEELIESTSATDPAARTTSLLTPAMADVEETLARLRAMPALANARIEPLHGKMPSDEKDLVMRSFADGQIDVLVATTVIEVGVDVPNASTMVVLDADRFGVSQLHQLRGRVGRGRVPGICLFVTHAEPGSLARERVEAVASTLDGFELAQIDLELRREGDVLGTTQSGGRSSLKLLRVARDADLIMTARAAAEQLLEVDPELARYPALVRALARRLDESEREFLAKT
ncbi:ATP-dependent DNA helicase RecG [Homoserinimonas sp. OAct 916]|uniref:ATP-dependent DNA helicase RecG n=1 Tax=Homoserinimonas sp. OAct 916 TaxID=2211450 RepID=UPI000DBE45FE|nr:ATP-dependent DNA helicase RecG [Homoserinimonas sp. OAct 916]